MSVQKNPLLMVRALGLLRDLPWHCTILGDGPLLDEAKAEAIRLGLNDALDERLDFRGWSSSTEVSEAMRESDILLIPSLSEGLPMVAVEALAHGLALVGSRIGGLADVAHDTGDHVNARLFELSQGAEGFAAALGSLLLDSNELMKARNASLAMASRFDLRHSLDQYERLLVSAAQ